MSAGRATARVELAQVQRPMLLFAQAIAGKPVAMRISPPARPGLASWPGPSRDGLIVLPSSFEHWDERALNLADCRVAILRQLGSGPGLDAAQLRALARQAAQAGDTRPGSAPTSLASRRPVLLWRLFRMAERLRVDTVLAHDYPGARADLQRLRQGELELLPAPVSGRPVSRCLHALWRHALGDSVPTADPLVQSLIAMQETVAQAGAGPLDSARVAMQICHALVRACHSRPVPLRATGAGLRILPHLAEGASGAGANAAQSGDGESDEIPDDTPEGAAALSGDAPGQASERRLRGIGAGSLHDAGRDQRARADDHDARRRPVRPAVRPGSDRAGLAALLRPDAQAQAPDAWHDEWDYLAQRYLPAWCAVREHRLRGTDLHFIQQVRERHAEIADAVRRSFAAIRPQSQQRLRRLQDGEEIDLDCAIDERVGRRAGHISDGRVYSARRSLARDVSAAFLMDMSGSTGFLIPQPREPGSDADEADDSPYLHAASPVALSRRPPARRVIDLARESLCLMCDALHLIGDRHAVYGFSGNGRHQVEFHVAKEFHEPWSAHSAAALSAMQPRHSTRTGAAIRHTIARMAREPSRTRVLILITDGYPQDSDYGPEPSSAEYGIHDTARALHEAALAGITSFCITIDVAAHDYLRRMCAPQHYLVIDELAELPDQLSKVYRALTAA